MKNLVLTLALLLPLAATAQYEITKEELLTKGALDSKNDIELKIPEEIALGKIIFKGIDQTDYDQIVIKNKDQTGNLDAEAFKDGKKIYDLKDAIINDEQNKFVVIYKNQEIGTISFTLKGGKEKESETKFESYVGAMVSANFGGDNKFLANLTPVVNLGGVVQMTSPKKPVFWELDISPYFGGDMNAKDSVAFVPAMMLPGKVGMILNNYIHYDIGKTRITLMPLGLGLKFIPNFRDSALTVMQHNVRTGISLKYSDFLVLGFQYTHGWHNLSSQSEANFKKIFGNTSTDIDYLTVTAQFAMVGKESRVTNYLYFEWRGLLNSQRYAPFNNNRILTIGVRKTLELTGGGVFAAAAGKKASSSKKRHRVHGGF